MHWFPVLPPTVTDNFSCCKSCPYHWMVTKRMTQIYGSRSQKNRPETAAPPAPPAGLAFQLTPFPPKKKITRQRRFSFVYGCVFKTHWIQSASKMLVIYIYICVIYVCVCVWFCMHVHIRSYWINQHQRCSKMFEDGKPPALSWRRVCSELLWHAECRPWDRDGLWSSALWLS